MNDTCTLWKKLEAVQINYQCQTEFFFQFNLIGSLSFTYEITVDQQSESDKTRHTRVMTTDAPALLPDREPRTTRTAHHLTAVAADLTPPLTQRSFSLVTRTVTLLPQTYPVTLTRPCRASVRGPDWEFFCILRTSRPI